jgi:hypothetical protein
VGARRRAGKGGGHTCTTIGNGDWLDPAGCVADGVAAAARGQEAPALDRLLERLQSPDWLTRAKAAVSLDRLLDIDPTQRALPAVQEAVAALLERENGVIDANYRRGP